MYLVLSIYNLNKLVKHAKMNRAKEPGKTGTNHCIVIDNIELAKGHPGQINCSTVLNPKNIVGGI